MCVCGGGGGRWFYCWKPSLLRQRIKTKKSKIKEQITIKRKKTNNKYQNSSIKHFTTTAKKKKKRNKETKQKINIILKKTKKKHRKNNNNNNNNKYHLKKQKRNTKTKHKTKNKKLIFCCCCFEVFYGTILVFVICFLPFYLLFALFLQPSVWMNNVAHLSLSVRNVYKLLNEYLFQWSITQYKTFISITVLKV